MTGTASVVAASPALALVRSRSAGSCICIAGLSRTSPRELQSRMKRLRVHACDCGGRTLGAGSWRFRVRAHLVSRWTGLNLHGTWNT
jgi:hypothetical protein